MVLLPIGVLFVRSSACGWRARIGTGAWTRWLSSNWAEGHRFWRTAARICRSSSS